MALGRGFLPEEDEPQSPMEVVLSHQLWQAVLGSDPDIIGKSVSIEGGTAVVVGVAAPDPPVPPGRRCLGTTRVRLEELRPAGAQLGRRGSPRSGHHDGRGSDRAEHGRRASRAGCTRAVEPSGVGMEVVPSRSPSWATSGWRSSS